MKIAITLLLASLVVGQLLRLPLPGQGGGLLLSDVATVLVLFAAYIQWIKFPKKFGHWSLRKATWLPRNFTLVIGIFILWSLLTLTLHASSLGLENTLIAAAYWLRLTATLLLLPALLLLLQRPTLRLFTHRAFVMTILSLALLGFLQLAFFPNLSEAGLVLRSLGEGGWDPHQGRLVATWLDPNFIGGFFAMVLPWMLTRIFLPLAKGESPAWLGVRFHRLITHYALLITISLALLLTQSRSSLVALGLGAATTAPLWLIALRSHSRAVQFTAVAGSLSFLVALIVFPALLLPERIAGLLLVDDTAALRVSSLKNAWSLAEAHPILGVGYNAYQFAARDAGLIGDFTLHSRAGADNSLLTLWVTTGLIGVVLFFLPWAAVTARLAHLAYAGSLSAAAAVTSFAVLLVHSQFVNSFLYSHLLITLIVVVTLEMTNSQTPMSNE